MNGEYDRILGMLLGCAIGDAMGMPAEMWSRRRIRSYFGHIDGFLPGPPENEISGGFAPGETTDDTIVTFIVAKALIETKGRPAPLDIVERIERWSAENPKSKTIIGPSTRRAFEQISRGVPAEQAGRYGETNGASMRISPVGAICRADDPEDLCARVAAICMPTHNTATAISGACAVAAAVAHGVGGGAIASMIAPAAEAARRGADLGYDVCGASVAERLLFSAALSDATPDDEAFLQRQYELIGAGLPTTESVPTALAVAYRTRGDVLRCAKMCANLGGDTDTLGAIACAVAGAHSGAAAVDADAAARVRQVNGHDFDATAQALCALRAQLHPRQ